MKNGTFIALHDKYQFKYLFKYPARYIIQLFCGAKKDHCAIALGNYIIEFKFAGVIITPQEEWKKNLDKQTVVTFYDLRKEFTQEDMINAEYYIKTLMESDVKYSLIEFVFSKIPFLKKIKFRKDKYMYCDKFYLRILQEIELLPPELNCGVYSVDDIPDLLDDFKLLNGGQKRRDEIII